MRDLLRFGLVVALLVPLSAGAARPFAVADSIEMTRVNTGLHWFDDPGATGMFYRSPDGEHTLAVLRKGNLATGQNDYQLVMFDTEHVLAYVNETRRSRVKPQRPVPEVLAAFSTAAWIYGIDRVQWHPNGRSALFVGRGPDEIGQIFSIDLDGREVRQLTRHAQDIDDFALSADGRTLVYAARAAPEDWAVRNARGYTLTSDFIHDLTLKDPKDAARRYLRYFILDRITGRVIEANIPRTFSPLGIWLAPSGRWAVTLVPSRGIPANWRAYTLVESMLTEQERPLEPSVAALSQVGATETFVDEAFGAFPSSVINQFYLIDTANGQARPLINAPAVLVGFGKAIWIEDEFRVLFGPTFLPLDVPDPTERERRRHAPSVVDLDLVTGAIRQIAELETIRVTPGSPPYRRGLLSGLEHNADGSVQVEYRDFRTGSAGPTPAVQRFRLVAGRWTEERSVERPVAARDPNARLKYSLVEDMNTPPEIAVLDRKSGRQRAITDLNPQLRELNLGRTEAFEWRDQLGRIHTGGLVMPPSYRSGIRYPAVIQTYGFSKERFLVDGPPLASKAAFAAQALANSGILVLQMPTSSGASDTTGPYNSIGENPRFIAMLESAIDALDNRGFIDRNRIGLIGFSRSGMHVLNAITFSAHPIAAATSADSITDTVLSYVAYFGHPDWGGMTDWERPQQMGAPFWGNGIRLWVERSTAFHLDRVRTPLRLEMYGTGVDPRWDTYAMLKRFRRPVEFVRIPNARHVVTQPWAIYTSQQGNVDWFRFWLTGEEDQDPAKAQQYVRWRQLRAQHEAHLKEVGAHISAAEPVPAPGISRP